MNLDQMPVDSDQWMHGCLHYYVLNDIADYMLDTEPPIYGVAHQIISYCFRPLNKSEDDFYFLNTRDESFTFEQLRLNNISSHQLYLWSAPIDIIEQYKIYLNNDTSLSETRYYNCTKSWFGPSCQYSFDLQNKSIPFPDIVKEIFQYRKFGFFLNIENMLSFPCYTYLDCNRGGLFSVCLDWREICDGKIDCINNGIDEQDCDQLEVNECNEKEYRCHNGQCIPEDFLSDNLFNPECLDMTDEPQQFLELYTPHCITDPAFRCEDIKCRPSATIDIVCGDGQCASEQCSNQRHVLLKKAMIGSTRNLTDECRDAILCLTEIDKCKTKINIPVNCPDIVQFPGDPVLFGHVKFIYTPNKWNYSSQNILLPTYICYDARLCHFSSSISVHNHSTCQHIDRLIRKLNYISSWSSLITNLKEIFYTCSVIEGGYCSHSHVLYRCNSTIDKCISKHHLMDGIQNCILNDDENYIGSCLLNNGKHRLRCGGKCLTRILPATEHIRNSCPDREEKENHIHFQIICDGILDLSTPLIIDGENHTDESECAIWPCVNTYTRCDGIWTCPNGADEVNCEPSRCPSREHMCISPVNYSLICLPIEKAGDGIVDCIGGSDERQLCRKSEPLYKGNRFWCSSNTSCVSTLHICTGVSDCEYTHHSELCSKTSWPCTGFHPDLTEFGSFLCSLTDSKIHQVVPLSLRYSRIYPATIENSTTISYPIAIEKTSILKPGFDSDNLNKDTNWHWRCNRGLSILVLNRNNNSKEGCLCPPSYFGDLCQYQNQRVSLTLQLRVSSDWRTVFFCYSYID